MPVLERCAPWRMRSGRQWERGQGAGSAATDDASRAPPRSHSHHKQRFFLREFINEFANPAEGGDNFEDVLNLCDEYTQYTEESEGAPSSSLSRLPLTLPGKQKMVHDVSQFDLLPTHPPRTCPLLSSPDPGRPAPVCTSRVMPTTCLPILAHSTLHFPAPPRSGTQPRPSSPVTLPRQMHRGPQQDDRARRGQVPPLPREARRDADHRGGPRQDAHDRPRLQPPDLFHGVLPLQVR